MSKKERKKDWFGIIAYVIGISAILFTVIMILIMVLKWKPKFFSSCHWVFLALQYYYLLIASVYRDSFVLSDWLVVAFTEVRNRTILKNKEIEKQKQQN